MNHKLAAAFNQGGKFPTIGCVNLATVPLGNYTLEALTGALQKFLDEHFVPIWGYPAKLQNYATLEEIPKEQWVFMYIDDPDVAGALGYHDLTKDGQPVSKIFVKTTQENGEEVSVTACHELAEMVIDPGAQLWAMKTDGSLVAYEMSDPVEEDVFEIDGINMSNFVMPAYFEGWHKGKNGNGVKFDYLGKLTKPFSMTKGGYLIVADGGEVKQIFGSAAKKKRFEKEDRRGHRSEFRFCHAENDSVGQVLTPEPAMIPKITGKEKKEILARVCNHVATGTPEAV